MQNLTLFSFLKVRKGAESQVRCRSSLGRITFRIKMYLLWTLKRRLRRSKVFGFSRSASSRASHVQILTR